MKVLSRKIGVICSIFYVIIFISLFTFLKIEKAISKELNLPLYIIEDRDFSELFIDTSNLENYKVEEISFMDINSKKEIKSSPVNERFFIYEKLKNDSEYTFQVKLIDVTSEKRALYKSRFKYLQSKFSVQNVTVNSCDVIVNYDSKNLIFINGIDVYGKNSETKEEDYEFILKRDYSELSNYKDKLWLDEINLKPNSVYDIYCSLSMNNNVNIVSKKKVKTKDFEISELKSKMVSDRKIKLDWKISNRNLRFLEDDSIKIYVKEYGDWNYSEVPNFKITREGVYSAIVELEKVSPKYEIKIAYDLCDKKIERTVEQINDFYKLNSRVSVNNSRNVKVKFGFDNKFKFKDGEILNIYLVDKANEAISSQKIFSQEISSIEFNPDYRIQFNDLKLDNVYKVLYEILYKDGTAMIVKEDEFKTLGFDIEKFKISSSLDKQNNLKIKLSWKLLEPKFEFLEGDSLSIYIKEKDSPNYPNKPYFYNDSELNDIFSLEIDIDRELKGSYDIKIVYNVGGREYVTLKDLYINYSKDNIKTFSRNTSSDVASSEGTIEKKGFYVHVKDTRINEAVLELLYPKNFTFEDGDTLEIYRKADTGSNLDAYVLHKKYVHSSKSKRVKNSNTENEKKVDLKTMRFVTVNYLIPDKKYEFKATLKTKNEISDDEVVDDTVEDNGQGGIDGVEEDKEEGETGSGNDSDGSSSEGEDSKPGEDGSSSEGEAGEGDGDDDDGDDEVDDNKPEEGGTDGAGTGTENGGDSTTGEGGSSSGGGSGAGGPGESEGDGEAGDKDEETSSGPEDGDQGASDENVGAGGDSEEVDQGAGGVSGDGDEEVEDGVQDSENNNTNGEETTEIVGPGDDTVTKPDAGNKNKGVIKKSVVKEDVPESDDVTSSGGSGGVTVTPGESDTDNLKNKEKVVTTKTKEFKIEKFEVETERVNSAVFKWEVSNITNFDATDKLEIRVRRKISKDYPKKNVFEKKGEDMEGVLSGEVIVEQMNMDYEAELTYTITGVTHKKTVEFKTTSESAQCVVSNINENSAKLHIICPKGYKFVEGDYFEVFIKEEDKDKFTPTFSGHILQEDKSQYDPYKVIAVTFDILKPKMKYEVLVKFMNDSSRSKDIPDAKTEFITKPLILRRCRIDSMSGDRVRIKTDVENNMDIFKQIELYADVFYKPADKQNYLSKPLFTGSNRLKNLLDFEFDLPDKFKDYDFLVSFNPHGFLNETLFIEFELGYRVMRLVVNETEIEDEEGKRKSYELKWAYPNPVNFSENDKIDIYLKEIIEDTESEEENEKRDILGYTKIHTIDSNFEENNSFNLDYFINEYKKYELVVEIVSDEFKAGPGKTELSVEKIREEVSPGEIEFDVPINVEEVDGLGDKFTFSLPDLGEIDVTEDMDVRCDIEGVSARFVDNGISVKGLVPGKEYPSIEIRIIVEEGKELVFNIENIRLEPEEDSQKFLYNVYIRAFIRDPDEGGYQYWLERLKTKDISARDFLMNLLFAEKEFSEMQYSTEKFIEVLYSIIVDRDPDREGLGFWINFYNEEAIKNANGDVFAAKSYTVQRMINEEEFKKLILNMGFKY